MGRASGPSAAPPWLGRLQDYYWIHDLLRVSLGVPAWAMVWDGKAIAWLDLSLVLPPLAPYHFEMAAGKDRVRDAYHARCLRRTLESGRCVEGELYGCRDLFVPVGRHTGRGASAGGTVLYFGQYLDAPPDHDALGRQWAAMSGRQAVQGDPEFDAYVSSVLGLAVLPSAAREGLQEFGRLFAAHLRGDLERKGLVAKLDRLRKRAFTPWLPHPVWAHQAIGHDRQRPVPWAPGRELAPWMREDLGLSRPPTAVLTLLPMHQDPLRARVLGKALTVGIWAWCRRRGGVTAAPWNEDGVLLLAETRPGRGPGRVRADLAELAREAQAFALSSLKARITVGIGLPVEEGERLLPSYRQAVLALQLAVQEELPLRFYGPADARPAPFTYVTLARSARELATCFEGGEAASLSLAAKEHVRGVLEYAQGRLDLARGQFLASLFQCLEASGRRHRAGEDSLGALGKELGAGLERCQGMVELLRAYDTALRRLALLSSGKGGGPALQGFLSWLLEHHQQPLTLASAARQAGLSVPAFTRAFRRATGGPFKPYLHRLRCGEAARLLRSTDLTVGEIALRCGFSSTHHLSRSFVRQHRSTPGAYRRRARKEAIRYPK